MNIPVASVKDLPPGSMMGVEAQGEAILLANVQGRYYAIGDICTHMGCNLSEGTLTGENVECSCHSAVFDLRTGAVLRGSASLPERMFEVNVENGEITISL